ncbi:MAG: ATP-binding cassette domain-containing protein [Actinomycetota bacterium]|nr:ATP-binding cassette domain-containing protein [Actinomycetota bacterium]
MSILKIDGLSAGYGPVRVLHDLDLEINPGERVGLVGLNGHGKTTLLSTIVGLTGWQDGSIEFRGEQIGGRRSHGMGRTTPHIVRKGIALAPQGDAIFPGLSVKDNLDSGAYSGATWRSRRRRRERILEIFPPLAKLLGQSAGTLSGGERRMVSVGRALMSDATLYLVDEPSLGLAPKISVNLVAALCEIDLGDGAMIIAEQNLPLLEGRVDRVLGMHAGELKLDVGEALGDVPPAAGVHL